jgi:hypothetical protein
MLQLQPLGNPPAKAIAGRYVRLSNWQVAAYRNGGDAMTMVYGTPARDSAIVTAIADLGSMAFQGGSGADFMTRIQQDLNNQAVYIQRPEHEVRRPW